MKIHHLAVEEAIRSLRSREDGLSTDEAARRLHAYGPNAIEQVSRVPLPVRFLQQFTHFFALILWVAAGLAFLAERRAPGEGMAILGWAILGVIGVNGLFAFWQEYRAERALQVLQQLLPDVVTVRRDDALRQIPVRELVPGDIILLAEGDEVPADCRVIGTLSARVSTATITGEAAPVTVSTEPSQTEDLLESNNTLLAGTALVAGEVAAVVFATGMYTEFGKIAHLTQTVGEAPSPLQREITHVSRRIAMLATGIGISFFLIGEALHMPLWQNALFAIGIIVANVPEGLLPTVTLSLAMASQRMARRQALVRHLPSVETLGAASVICTDKTGTLTENRMDVVQVFLGGELYSRTELEATREVIDTYRLLFAIARHCQTLRETRQGDETTLVGDPMEVALVAMARKLAPEMPTYPRLDDIPFDTDRKRLSTLHQTPDGNMLYTKGALEALLPLCRSVQVGPEQIPLTEEWATRTLQAEERMARRGLRVLALAYRPLPADTDRKHWEESLILLGLVGLEDPPRPEVPGAIARCQQAGIKVIMTTGDHPLTALAIARQIGLVRTDTPCVVTGDQLRRLSDIQLRLALETPEILFARVAPGQKTRIVSALQMHREVVAVTGDGVNDAPALKQADIGIAMGVVGTDVAKEASDVVLLDDNFASIVTAVEEGRTVYENIRKFLTYILTSNIAELVPFLAFALFAIPLPLTILQILAVDLGTDMLPALALGAEPPDARGMSKPPRARTERLFTWPVFSRAYLFLGLMEAGAGMAAFFYVLHQGGWQYGQPLAHRSPLYLQATTATLSAIVVMQVVNVFLCRSASDSVVRQGLFTNPLLLWGIALEVGLILVIDYTAVGNALFGTASIPLRVWLFTLPYAVGMLLVEELRKWIARRAAR